jgi:hypothetical protein
METRQEYAPRTRISYACKPKTLANGLLGKPQLSIGALYDIGVQQSASNRTQNCGHCLVDAPGPLRGFEAAQHQVVCIEWISGSRGKRKAPRLSLDVAGRMRYSGHVTRQRLTPAQSESTE